MDELVHHCLRELSFDGDLGCNVSRLTDFIAGFYTSQGDHSQSIDDAFCAFVWSIVVQQPSVRVGTLPPGSVSEVYIAPQLSAKRKAAAKGGEVTEIAPPTLQPVEDARRRHLGDLKCEYGDHLRIAVDPGTSFAAITGSHIRPPKLSPMVYSALQLITRGREDGITTVELGRKTNYDQKTCFYLIKQLVELGLVIKARRGGIGNHTCIHKYFFERSPLWQQIQKEEASNVEVIAADDVKPHETNDEATDQDNPSQISFDPIDSRHLSSLPLVKNRIVKLLKASINHIHQSNNLLMAIGFVNPTKTDRRFFQTRLRELIQQGVIERVLITSSKARNRTIKCIRLATSDNQLPEGSIVVRRDVDEDEKEASLDISASHNGVKANLTIHKQVSNMLEEAGPSGLTLNEICGALCNFDKRTIELLLMRASSNRPPAHLADLGIVDLMETYGRERRHRYFTIAAYKCIMASERLQDTSASAVDVDLSRVKDFAALDPNHFYATTGRLHSYQDSFKDLAISKSKKRKRDEEGNIEEESEVPPKRKRGRPRKVPVPTSASVTLPKKRGRPRKNQLAKIGESQGAAASETSLSTLVGAEQVAPSNPLATSHLTGEVSNDGNHTVQVEPNVHLPPEGNSMDATAGPTRTVQPTEQSVSPGSGPFSERCEVGASFLQDVGDVQSCPSPSRSSKRATTVDVIAPRDDVTASYAFQLLKTDVQRKSPIQVVQEVSTAMLPVSALQLSSCQTLSNFGPSNLVQAAMEESLSTPSPSVGTSAGEKLRDVTSPLSSRPSKRSRTNGGAKPRSNINISSLRRENELFKVIENMGGIANMHAKDIFEAHTALLDTMSLAKEPTSAPAGTRLDKRTAESTLKNLENRGRIRMLKTSLITPSSVTRPACLVYLPDTPQEKVNAFLHQLSQSGPVSAAVSEKDTRDLESARQRIKRKRKVKEQRAEAKSALRKKAEETRAQREQDWDDLIKKIHPEPVKGTLVIRIRAVRSRFLQSTITGDRAHWENEIQAAIRETQLVSKKMVSRPKSKLRAGVAAGPPPVVSNPPEKSIEILIAQQGPSISSAKKRGKEKEESGASRRPRFHWTREFDELARDASAIIRARCRASKLDLSALDQVFPAVPRNSVRQRITHLRESAAEDVYMQRLEDQWYTVWCQYRGTPHLLDDDPGSPSNFNLINHIEFLRKHVDKNALRVGFVEREAPRNLTLSVNELYELYEVGEEAASAPVWDFMWGTTVEEGREKQFRSQAFTKEPNGIYECTKDQRVQLAEVALKMVFGTPVYDSDSAACLLHSVGDQCVSVAKSNLLHQGVLSKLVRDPKKQKPGRMLKISDTNLNVLGGPFPRDLFQDAISLEDVAIEKVVDEMEWPLIATEGDIVTLLQLVSEDQVDFTVDLSHSRSARRKIDWNSKRADDDDIETSIRLKFSRMPVISPGGNEDRSLESPAVELNSNTLGRDGHGTTLYGKKAACALETETGLIDCPACINTAFTIFLSSLAPLDREVARRILDLARSSRETGLDKAEFLGLGVGLEQHILLLTHRMTLTSPPILVWIYFNTPTLVAADYCASWSVTVSNEPLTLVAPRRWLDLRGYRLDGAWETARQALVGVIFLHPGISQIELRWRLRAAYDRQEVIDILTSLQEDGILECRTEAGVDAIQSVTSWLKTLDDGEAVFWFIARNQHWYQI